MGRQPALEKGIRLSIYLKESQLKWLDEQVAKENTTRTAYIQERVFPVRLRTVKSLSSMRR